MFLSRILPGILSAYLVAAPCLVLDHSSEVDVNNISVAQTQDSHGHTHNAEEADGEDQEHCCEDLSSSIHAPLKQLPTSVAFVAIVPSLEMIIPYVHLEQHTALSRDGPLFEHAREFASTIVVRV